MKFGSGRLFYYDLKSAQLRQIGGEAAYEVRLKAAEQASLMAYSLSTKATETYETQSD